MAVTRRSSVDKGKTTVAGKAKSARVAAKGKIKGGVAQSGRAGAERPQVAGSNPAPTSDAFASLNPRHQRFVLEYLKDGNAAGAYLRAGYQTKPDAAAVSAHALLRNPKVAAAIEARREKVFNRLEITQERILQEMARIAFFDPRRLFDVKGEPLPLIDLDADDAAVIAGLDVLEEYEGSGEGRRFVGYVKKWKLADKPGMLKELARLQGMYEKDNRQKGASMGEQLATFIGKLHQAGSRLPIRGSR